ncbi:MAG: peroxiredoxin [Candidatus Berkiellales bacterium]
MNKIAVGDPAPDFGFESTDPSIHSFKDLLGKNIVLYFYPKDNTPGCTLEGQNFKALYPAFLEVNTQILGISRDLLASHQKFCAKLGLPFPLITDRDEKLCKYFNVIIEKNMFARLVFGIERSTFLIDEKGIIRHIWRKVKVNHHAEEVLSFVKNMK